MKGNIHPSAVIEPGARLGKNVTIGPFCFIGSSVILEDNVVLHSHVVVEGRTIIGENSIIFPFASIGHAPQDLKYSGEASWVKIGKNNLIREYVTIQPGTSGGNMETVIGDNCLLMAGVHIAHDCIVGNNVIFANLATLAGHVSVGDFSVLGGLCAVHQWVRIGHQVMIGGGAIVLNDVPPFATVTSQRDTSIASVNIIGLKRRNFGRSDIARLQKAFDLLFFQKGQDLKIAIQLVKTEYSDDSLVQQLIEFLENESRRSYTRGREK